MKPLFLLVCVLLASSFFIPMSAMPIQNQYLAPLKCKSPYSKSCNPP
ncbi:hypothetical protein V6Z12_A11G325600 [Gossypium hirsutum]